ncbi:N-formylglutamate deformylase [Telmatospirillum sp. J64-1]|uniref:N-formylglutamate deformylase n=1 Tax=Telmatospirillum sp. J64-1 TaxID=2502183 RepID=UPI00115CB99E|nr:N-formylglutamate deformylase [Telmatospirillum sp. J64-1]
MTAPIFTLHRGDSPLVVSIPHCGTELSPGLADRLTEEALTLRDTDWHVPRLYDFALEMGATVIAARYSRYVVDLNRPSTGESLYPGQATTGLCPTTLFDGQPLYRDGQEPDEAEIARRVEEYWQPYHQALTEEVARVKALHGHAVLYDAHSIRSHVPRLFEGRLPDLNLGTARGASCPEDLRGLLAEALKRADEKGFTGILDGRFVGGHITRHFGRPAEGVSAVQMELSQDTYMDESGPPFAYLPERADRLRPVLRDILDILSTWRPKP